MWSYVARRLLLMIPALFGICLINFCVIKLAPGNPTSVGGASEGLRRGQIDIESYNIMRKQFHLDEPIWRQFIYWMGDVLRGDFGQSMAINPGKPVAKMIAEALAVTLRLNVMAIAIIYMVSIPLGIFSARHRGSLVDSATSTVLFGLYSLPNFWVATMLIIYLAGNVFLNIFPSRGLSPDNPDQYPFLELLARTAWHYVLPLVVLTYGGLAALSRYCRVGFLEVLRQDYIRTARAKGLPERVVVWKHAARNSLIPVITIMATLLPAMIGGSVVVEWIFSIPGMGQLAVNAVFARDYTVIMAINFIAAVLTLIGLLLTDIAYACVDPRIQLK